MTKIWRFQSCERTPRGFPSAIESVTVPKIKSPKGLAVGIQFKLGPRPKRREEKLLFIRVKNKLKSVQKGVLQYPDATHRLNR